jgi:hypothetical protein
MQRERGRLDQAIDGPSQAGLFPETAPQCSGFGQVNAMELRGYENHATVDQYRQGMSRNGAEYCEDWVPAAERHGLLIVAITFPKARDSLLAGLDAIGVTLRDADLIAAWQARDRPQRPWSGNFPSQPRAPIWPTRPRANDQALSAPASQCPCRRA